MEMVCVALVILAVIVSLYMTRRRGKSTLLCCSLFGHQALLDLLKVRGPKRPDFVLALVCHC
jgi:hypothetical protein